jgi:hypothetical protein
MYCTAGIRAEHMFPRSSSEKDFALKVPKVAESKWRSDRTQKVPDFLEGMWDTIMDIYAGNNDPKILGDSRLSPTRFESRDKLPKHIFMIGVSMTCSATKRRPWPKSLSSISLLKNYRVNGELEMCSESW